MQIVTDLSYERGCLLPFTECSLTVVWIACIKRVWVCLNGQFFFATYGTLKPLKWEGFPSIFRLSSYFKVVSFVSEFMVRRLGFGTGRFISLTGGYAVLF